MYPFDFHWIQKILVLMYKPKTRVSVHDAITRNRLTIQLQFCTVLYVMLLLIIMLRGSLDFVGLTLYNVQFPNVFGHIAKIIAKIVHHIISIISVINNSSIRGVQVNDSNKEIIY
jgi:hypothetical protein